MDKPIKATLRGGSWKQIFKRLRSGRCSEFTVTLKARPEMFKNPESVDFKEKEIKMKASLSYTRDCIYISKLEEYGSMGDEDGFGVEPDTYLSAIVSPDGTFITLLS